MLTKPPLATDTGYEPPDVTVTQLKDVVFAALPGLPEPPQPERLPRPPPPPVPPRMDCLPQQAHIEPRPLPPPPPPARGLQEHPGKPAPF
jgi:hypothetical protein